MPVIDREFLDCVVAMDNRRLSEEIKIAEHRRVLLCAGVPHRTVWLDSTADAMGPFLATEFDLPNGDVEQFIQL